MMVRLVIFLSTYRHLLMNLYANTKVKVVRLRVIAW